MAARRKSAGPRKAVARPAPQGGRRGEAPASRGAGRTGPVKPSTGRPSSGKSTTGRTASGSGSKSSSRTTSASRTSGPKSPSRNGAARVPAERAGPIKPGRPAGRGVGREAPKDRGDDLGGTQVEGRQAVRELLIAGRRRAYEIWIAGDADRSDVLDDIREIARANRVPVVEVSRRKLDQTARSEAPQGVLAHAAPVPAATFDSLIARRPGRAPFLVAVDGVTDPGNLGALLRCCDGAGVTGVVLPRHRSVHITPTVAKAAVGAVEHVPMAVVAGLPAALAKMKREGIWIVGLDDAAGSSLFDLGNLATDAVCLVLGSEGAGLSRLVRERCDLIVSIPMKGRLSSLNVSAAAALATYEIARHRR
jgi:23S rRNA (guanosine2251-2'-O)-methyltransferase